MGNIYIDNRDGSGRTGGCLPAVLSFVVPGLGQLLLGRVGRAVGHFLVALALWAIALGWIVHFYSAWDASR